jgi:hypothetical protein
MAKKTNADYKREQYARKKEAAEKLGIVDRVLPVPASINTMLNELCERHAYTDWRELVFTMIRVCHAGADALAVIPPSGFVPSEKQLRKVGTKPTCAICRDLGELCAECEEGYD